MNIYSKIDALYDESNSCPSWALEIKNELKEIKILLQENKITKNKSKRNTAYFEFVSLLRQKLMPDTTNNIYPELQYMDKTLGANFKGFLYDKATTQQLSAMEAFKAYEYFYTKKDDIDQLIKID